MPHDSHSLRGLLASPLTLPSATSPSSRHHPIRVGDAPRSVPIGVMTTGGVPPAFYMTPQARSGARRLAGEFEIASGGVVRGSHRAALWRRLTARRDDRQASCDFLGRMLGPSAGTSGRVRRT